jgi:hypothetical protein
MATNIAVTQNSSFEIDATEISFAIRGVIVFPPL